MGQGLDADVTAMQVANPNVTPVGNIGAALGCLAKANVQESIAWVNKFNLVGYFPDIEMGFGDATVSGKKLNSSLQYSSLNKIQLDDLDNKGYVFCASMPDWKAACTSQKTRHVLRAIIVL